MAALLGGAAALFGLAWPGRFRRVPATPALMDERRRFDGRLYVHYGQAYVLPAGTHGVDLNEAFRGQTNGLLGAAVQGSLFLITGLHTGYVGFTFDVLTQPPDIKNEWEEVVEASFVVGRRPVALEQWGGEGTFPISIAPGTYRARYCARNFGLGEQAAESPDPVEFYSLEFWPAPPAPDLVLRQTSTGAAYWHNHARSLKKAAT